MVGVWDFDENVHSRTVVRCSYDFTFGDTKSNVRSICSIIRTINWFDGTNHFVHSYDQFIRSFVRLYVYDHSHNQFVRSKFIINSYDQLYDQFLLILSQTYTCTILVRFWVIRGQMYDHFCDHHVSFYRKLPYRTFYEIWDDQTWKSGDQIVHGHEPWVIIHDPWSYVSRSYLKKLYVFVLKFMIFRWEFCLLNDSVNL